METAKEFLEAGNFYWNFGMFCFRANVFLDKLKKYEPKVYEKSKEAYDKGVEGKLPFDESMQIPSISVDSAVMERTKKVKAVKLNFQWSDIGSFESVCDYLLSIKHLVDKNGNMVIGSEIDTEFLGMKKSVSVITNDAILILK